METHDVLCRDNVRYGEIQRKEADKRKCAVDGVLLAKETRVSSLVR